MISDAQRRNPWADQEPLLLEDIPIGMNLRVYPHDMWPWEQWLAALGQYRLWDCPIETRKES